MFFERLQWCRFLCAVSMFNLEAMRLTISELNVLYDIIMNCPDVVV